MSKYKNRTAVLGKTYLIKRGWSYTGKFPHKWKDPESNFPISIDESLYDVDDAVKIQKQRDGLPEVTEPQIASRVVIETVERVDALFAEVDLNILSPERMTVARIQQMLKDEIELANGHRLAGLLGTRRNEYRKREDNERAIQ